LPPITIPPEPPLLESRRRSQWVIPRAVPNVAENAAHDSISACSEAPTRSAYTARSRDGKLDAGVASPAGPVPSPPAADCSLASRSFDPPTAAWSRPLAWASTCTPSACLTTHPCPAGSTALPAPGPLLLGGSHRGPGYRLLTGEAGAGRRCANQTPAATSPTTGHSTTPVTASAPAARYTTGIGAPANACSATVTGASSTAFSVAADEPDGAGAFTAGPAAGVWAGGVFGDAGMPCMCPQRGRATAPCCGPARLAAKDPAGPAPLPVGPPSPATPSRNATDRPLAAALATLNPGLRRLPPATESRSTPPGPRQGFLARLMPAALIAAAAQLLLGRAWAPSTKSWCAHRLPVAGLRRVGTAAGSPSPTGQGSIQCTRCARWSPARVRSSRPASPGRSPRLPDSLAVHPLAARGARRIRGRLQRLVVVFTRMANRRDQRSEGGGTPPRSPGRPLGGDDDGPRRGPARRTASGVGGRGSGRTRGRVVRC